MDPQRGRDGQSGIPSCDSSIGLGQGLATSTDPALPVCTHTCDPFPCHEREFTPPSSPFPPSPQYHHPTTHPTSPPNPTVTQSTPTTHPTSPQIPQAQVISPLFFSHCIKIPAPHPGPQSPLPSPEHPSVSSGTSPSLSSSTNPCQAAWRSHSSIDDRRTSTREGRGKVRKEK